MYVCWFNSLAAIFGCISNWVGINRNTSWNPKWFGVTSWIRWMLKCVAPVNCLGWLPVRKYHHIYKYQIRYVTHNQQSWVQCMSINVVIIMFKIYIGSSIFVTETVMCLNNWRHGLEVHLSILICIGAGLIKSIEFVSGSRYVITLPCTCITKPTIQ